MILYMTAKDAEILRLWINDERSVAWIVEVARDGDKRTWRAVDRIDVLATVDYCLWHRDSGPLNVPTGEADIPDAIILDPMKGWTQTAVDQQATTPWFGANLPGPYVLQVRERGKESPGSLARSEFGWLGDYFRPIGKEAHPAAKRWWTRAQRFIKQQATAIPWPYPTGVRRRAYAFPDAHTQIRDGRPLDVNPC
jgi:hypothetical protein